MTMKLAMMGIVAAAMAAPAWAQTTPPAPVAPVAAQPFVAPPIPPTDPARLAAARPVIDLAWPQGTNARMMHAMMDQYAQRSMANTFAMTPDALFPGLGAMTGDKAAAGETLGQMAMKKDPYVAQRLTIVMRVIGDEMAKLMGEMEPAMRNALAHAYARRFTVAELGDLGRFFATPTGRAYAADQMTLMMSPDMADAFQGFAPRMIQAMPAIKAKVIEATKGLPPVNAGSAGATRTP